MSDKIKGVIITKNSELGDQLTAEIRPVVDVTHTVHDYEAAFHMAREIQPTALFADLTENPKKDFEMIRRLVRLLPESRIFVLAREKDPDLILEGLRTGVTDYLIFPGKNGSIRQIVQKALGNPAGARRGELIALYSLQGGIGVTSLCVNLADHLSRLTGDKVLLADLNLYRGNVGIYLNMPSAYTVFDLIKDMKRMDQNLLFSSLAHHPNGFYILTAPEEISDADQVSGDEVRAMLNFLQQYMDYVVVDLPHDFSERSLAVLDAADTIFLITQQTLPVIKSVQRILDLFQELNYGEEKVRIVVNRRYKKSEFTPDDLSRIFKKPIFATIANDYLAATQAVNKGKTISTAHSKAAISRDISRLACRIVGATAPGAKTAGWKSAIGSLFSLQSDGSF